MLMGERACTTHERRALFITLWLQPTVVIDSMRHDIASHRPPLPSQQAYLKGNDPPIKKAVPRTAASKNKFRTAHSSASANADTTGHGLLRIGFSANKPISSLMPSPAASNPPASSPAEEQDTEAGGSYILGLLQMMKCNVRSRLSSKILCNLCHPRTMHIYIWNMYRQA